ncbi:MAG: histidine kinase [Sedimenticolaceae bacterium]
MTKARVRYQTVELGDTDFHLRTLRDRQQFEDDQHEAEELGVSPASWPLFGVVWESGEILARLMQTQDIEGLRVLEVGCGIAFASIVLRSRNADITATDRHPQAAAFLTINAALNELGPIAFVRTGWCEKAPQLGKFDLIIGSDLLYERSNVELLSGFIDRHTKRRCSVIIVDPGRGLQARFSRRMVALGYTHDSTRAVAAEVSASYRGRVMRFSRPG